MASFMQYLTTARWYGILVFVDEFEKTQKHYLRIPSP